MRLDIFLSKNLGVSRSQVAQLIAKKLVTINGKIAKKSGILVEQSDKIEILQIAESNNNSCEAPKSRPFCEKETNESNKQNNDKFCEFFGIAPTLAPKSDIFIERIYEDDDVLVLNKPPFLATHGAPSLREESLVEWLQARQIQLSTLSGEKREGIVHRLDKQTSGAMVVAKNNSAHAFLSEQLAQKSMGRLYLALIDLPLKESVEVECYLGRNPKNRLKFSKVANLPCGVKSLDFALDSAICAKIAESKNSPSLAEGQIYSSLRDLPKANRGNPLDSANLDSATRTGIFANTSSLRGESQDSPKQFAELDKETSALPCFVSEAKQPSKKNCHIERSEKSLLRFFDSAILSPNFILKSLIFSQKGLHPPTPLPPTRQKAAAFSLLGGSASLNPLLAKNRRLHYCNLESDFLHHEAGEFKGANAQFLNCHDSASQNLAMTGKTQNLTKKMQKIAESSAISQNLNAESNAKIVESNSQNTHPLAPSAREGGQIADSANRTNIAESQSNNRSNGGVASLRFHAKCAKIGHKSHLREVSYQNNANEYPKANFPKKSARYAKSHFYKLATSLDGKKELILARLFTGRTHQIRAHLECLNRHILGDELYGYKGKTSRVMLHSYLLYLTHPKNGKMRFQANIFDDMCEILAKNFDMEKIDEILRKLPVCFDL
ncbi:pseudouridine synthase [Helicobacter sp. 23-1044]